MLILNRLTKIITIFVMAAVLVSPASARNKKGDKLVKDAAKAEAMREWDKALELYEQAVSQDPADPAYLMGMRRTRFQAGQKHVEDGLKLRQAGKLEEAAATFQKAFATDPSSAIATQELKRTLAMIEAAKKKGGEKSEDRSSTPIETAQREAEQRIASIQSAPELKPITARITTLKMNNQPVKVLYETLGKLAGVNVIFDPEYQSTGKNYSVDFNNSTLDQALDQLSVLTKTFWKPLSANTIFLTNDNVTKRRDHEDMVVKAYYLKNLTTPQELQEVAVILRSVCDIRRVFTYNAQNIIMVRGEVDKVALADKLVADLDKAKSEVVIDIMVMEANRTRTRDLAASLVSGSQNGLSIPVAFTPRALLTGGTSGTGTGTGGTGTTGTTGTTGGGTTSIPLPNLPLLNGSDFSVTLPHMMLQALMTDRGTRVMQSPQMRATHGVKSSLKIGDKYPYATGSFQPGVGAVGVSPLVSTQFQFADVGVNVDITPTVHSSEEVTLQVVFDISNIRDRIDVGGLSQPVIGQRKLEHTVRLRQGEISLLGGLMQDQSTKSVSGTPGLAGLPIIKWLFSGESTEKNQSELLIAIIPHIVRSSDITDVNLRGVAAGTDQIVKLSFAPKAAESETKPPEAKPVEAPKSASPAPAAAPVFEPPAPAPPAQASSNATRISFGPGPVRTTLSAAVSLNLQLDNGTDIFGSPMRISWDPKVLRLNEVSRGTLLSGDGQQPLFTRNIRNDAGEVSIILNRLPGSAGVSGSGGLVNLVFQAVGKGSTEVKVAEVSLRNSQQQPVAVDAPAVTVNVE